MKIFLAFFCIFHLQLRAQEAISPILPNVFSLNTSYQNEDIFVSIGYLYELKFALTAEIRWGVGARRTFFQQTLFSKTDFLMHYNFLKTKKVEFGPSFQLSISSLQPRLFRSIQRYYSAELGYLFAYGKKLKITQGSYFAFRSTDFVSSKTQYPFLGYSLQLGFRYEF